MLGPNIDYYLPTVPNGPVTIDILDASGGLVNSYSSDAPAAAAVADVVAVRRRPADSDDPDAAPAFGRGRGGFAAASHQSSKA